MTRKTLRFTAATASLSLISLMSLSACTDDAPQANDETGTGSETSADSDSESESDAESESESQTTPGDGDGDAGDGDGDPAGDGDGDTTGDGDGDSGDGDGDTGGDGDGEPVEPIDPTTQRPLSSMVSVSLDPSILDSYDSIPAYVRALVILTDAGIPLPPGITFPLPAETTDTVRALEGLNTSVVVKWFDPLTEDESYDAPRYGANNDYIAYFGDNWSGAPQYSGSATSGWLWSNHEYISGDQPTDMSGPTGQYELLMQYLYWFGLVDKPAGDTWSSDELAAIVTDHKKQLGGSWFRVLQDPQSGEWLVNRSANNLRYDATSNTQVRVTGLSLSGTAIDDEGNELPAGVVPGIFGDCSGAQTPWGTVLTAEENVQSYYGDVEPCWTSQQQFIVDQGCDPGGDIQLTTASNDSGAFGVHPDPNHLKNRDFYGFMVEIDPGVAPDVFYGRDNPGEGHQKLGAMGRARWENATFAVNNDWMLEDGDPIVIYAANDRRGGRIYKFVTSQPYAEDMSKAEIRDLLAEGDLYVAHFADLDNDTGKTVGGETPDIDNRGVGQWIRIAADSTDIAPNAATLGADTTVAEALADQSWNGIAGFPDDDTVRRALWTAATKIGVRELNRPEDIEFNPFDARLYVAFTKHGRRVALDDDGVLYDPETQEMDAPTRPDPTGAVFAMEENDDPHSSTSFTYWAAFSGTQGDTDYDAANPDNVMIDADGGVWFGTDGNYSTNGHADAIYYLDLDEGHQNTYGQAFRVVAGPSDSEATGPALNSNSTSMFFNVQHPGEGEPSSWPAE